MKILINNNDTSLRFPTSFIHLSILRACQQTTTMRWGDAAIWKAPQPQGMLIITSLTTTTIQAVYAEHHRAVVASSRRRKEVESRMWALFYPSTYTQSLTIITLNVWTFIWYHRQPSGTTTITAMMKNMCRPRPDHARVAGWLALNGDSQWGRSL